MSPAAIETEGLTKRFGDVLAVDDLHMTVKAGEIYGFLGPNGAGKSTTINMLLDFIHPTGGSAQVLGLDSHDDSLEIRQRTGILPEGATLYPRLSGREHIDFVAESKDIDAEPTAMLDRVGLDREDQTRKVDGYSKGMQQRLALGMALTGNPDLLILDEPSSGLDPNGMAEMREIITEEAADGTTVFFSSHLLGEVEAVCDRVAILNDGRLVAEDTIEGLRELSNVDPVIELECDAEAETLDSVAEQLPETEGIVAASHEGAWLSVTCEEPGDKATAVRRVDEQVAVTDLLAEETSLEALFESYTTDSEATDDATVAEEPTAAEVDG